MKGVVFVGDRQLELRDYPEPTPGPGEVILAVKASGMCGSDLHTYRASQADRPRDKQFIAGHEPCGVIAERGGGVSEAQAPIGQRVMVHHYAGCGRCKHCLSGYAQMCLHGSIVYGSTGHGAHAPFMRLVSPSMLVPLPDELSFEEGAAVSCGTGTAYLALKRLDVSGRDTLAIYGQGPVGLSATMLGKAMGARIIAIDPAADRRALAQEFGAENVIDPTTSDPVVAVKELTRGEGAEATLDCSGIPEARVAAVQSASIWGRVCFVGERRLTTFDISTDIIHKQLTIYGSWTFSSPGQAECARFIVDRSVPLKRLLTHRFTLDEAADAYRLFDTQTTGKGIFVF